MKYVCSCGNEMPIKYNEYKRLINRWGVDYIRRTYKYSGIINSTCSDCEYKSHLPGLPLIYRDAEDKYDIKKHIKDTNESLYLFGEAGSGKTFLATLILKDIWKNKKTGSFLSYPEFIFSIQTDYENKASLVDENKTFSGCLVIDDFGVEKMTDFVRQVSYLIINYREQNRLQTIITSNFTLDEIDKYIDRRISSRISGWCKILKLSGDKRTPVK